MNQLPFDVHLEKEILGSMLYAPSCIAEIVEAITPDDFYYQQHQALYSEIVRLWSQDEALVNFVELVPFLEKNGMTIADVTEMANSIVTTASIDWHTERLKALAHLRELVQVGSEFTTWGDLRDRNEIQDALNKAEDKVARITDKAVPSTTLVSMPEALVEFQKVFDQSYENPNGVIGIPSGFADLDAITTGFKKQDLIILAARTSMGKTAFAVQLALNMAYSGAKGVFFELEMNQHSVTSRMVANKARVDSNDLITGSVSKEEKKRIDQIVASMCLDSEGLYLDTAPNMSLFEMKAKARKLKRKNELDFIIVDYLQLITVPKGTNRIEEVSMISRELKMLARELDVPVIALAQLSRAVETRNDKRPMLSDLRESGSIEQDADMVMFLYRDDYYDSESEDAGITEVIIAKQRNGALGKAKLLFRKEKTLFLPLEKHRNEEIPQIKQAQNEAAATAELLPWEEGEL